SFQMDLYEPLFVPRPTVEPEIFASLRPPSYQGAMGGWKRDEQSERKPGTGLDTFQAGRSSDKAPGRERQLKEEAKKAGEEVIKKLEEARKADDMDLRQGVASAAMTTELGEYFQYLIEQPVSLPRQKSALIPIVNQAVQGTRVSIYNQGVHT